jgi:Na+-driven multidrug efflux pump
VSRSDVMIFAGLGVAALIAIAYLSKKAGDAAGAIGSGIVTGASAIGGAINPVADSNLAYQGSSAVAGIFADYPQATIGSMFADTFKSSSEKAVDAMLSTWPAAPVKNVLNSAGTLTDSTYRDMVR